MALRRAFIQEDNETILGTNPNRTLPNGPDPQYGWDFPEEIPENSGKTPEMLSERFLEFPSRVRLGCPKPYNSRHLRLPERFQNSLPPQYGWGRLFFQNWFRRGPLRAGHGIPSSTGGISDPRDPDILKTVRVVNLLSVVNLLRVVIL